MMKNLGTPLAIEVLLHYYYAATPHPQFHTGPVKEITKALLEIGAIEKDEEGDDGVYVTAALGRAWVKALCNLPPPMAVYVDQMGNTIGEV